MAERLLRRRDRVVNNQLHFTWRPWRSWWCSRPWGSRAQVNACRRRPLLVLFLFFLASLLSHLLLLLLLLFVPMRTSLDLPRRLTARLFRWRHITSDKTVLSIVARGLRVRLLRPVRLRRSDVWLHGPTSFRRGLVEQISDWLKQGVIEPACSGPHLLSLLFAVPKASGALRWCLDLRYLNQFSPVPPLRLPGVQSTRQLLPRGCWMTRIDLTSAYQHVAVSPASRRLLGFRALGRRFRFRALPFGLNSAPAMFTRLLRPVQAFLHARGICMVRYLDDFFLWAMSSDLCGRQSAYAVALLEHLGFLVNYDKSELVPSQTCDFIGFTWRSTSASLHVQAPKITGIRRQALQILRADRSGQLTVRRLASLVGKATAMLPALREANFRRHALQRCVVYGLKTGGSWDALVHLSRSACRDARWWARLTQASAALGLPWRSPRPRRSMTVDASGVGWGGWMTSGSTVATTRAEWSARLRTQSFSSNRRETLACVLAFFTFRSRGLIPDSSTLLIRSDNSTAVSAIRRAGSRSPAIGKLIEPLLRSAARHSIVLSAEHVPGTDNILADRLSRWATSRNEWGLPMASWTALVHLWPELLDLTVDMFASAEHHLLSRFATLDWCREAAWCDAFSRSWAHECPLLTPPFNLIPAVLGRIMDDEPRLSLLLTPYWPSASWWATAMSVASSACRLPTAAIRPPPPPARWLQRDGAPTAWAAWLIRF